MKIERIQYSLVSATKEISRYAATQRGTIAADLSKEYTGGHHHRSDHDEDDDEEEQEKAAVPTAAGLHAQIRLLNITA
jgi:hypothetical protein